MSTTNYSDHLRTSAGSSNAVRHREKPSFVIKSILLSFSLVATFVVGYAVGTRTANRRNDFGIDEAKPESEEKYERDPNRGRPQVVPHRLMSLPDPLAEAGARESHDFISMSRKIALDHAQASQNLGIETAGNVMAPFLKGALGAMRSINPTMSPRVRAEMERDACKESASDLEDMVFIQTILIEPGLGSPQGLNCTFSRHKKEDVMLWLLLDAWNDMGRPDIPVLRQLRSLFSDARTLRRLLPREEQVRLRSSESSVTSQNQTVLRGRSAQ